ncbi:MAG TPA: ATP F0F1 synthase subunit B [Alphaproteobacteria bacterium]|nr:ATP F0F1 synthase subunit B [Alphaproteobacteria bacterium]
MHVTPEEIWVAFGFLAFIGILIYLKVHIKMAAGLDKRSVEIKAKLEEAQALRDEARELLSTYEKKLRAARQEAADIVAQAEVDAKVMAKEAHESLEASLTRRAKLAEDKIAQAEATALREVRKVAVEVAAAAAEKLIAENLSASQADALVDSAINDLPAKLN